MPNICSCKWVQAVPGERWNVVVGNDVLQARYVQPSGTLKDRVVTGACISIFQVQARVRVQVTSTWNKSSSDQPPYLPFNL